MNEQARQAYAEAQKESDAAHERDTEASQSERKHDGKTKEADCATGYDRTHSKPSPDSPGAKTKSPSTGDTPGEEQTDQSVKPEGIFDAELSKAQEKRIEELKKDLETARDDLARARADLYNLQQEYSAYAKRTKSEIPQQQEQGAASVVNALMSVLDDIDLARQHGDLEGSFGVIAGKLEQALEMQFKVKRYGVKGDPFDPNLHQAIQMLPGMEGKVHVIDQVAQPGYLMGERVLRPAMVVVGAPEPATEPEKGIDGDKSE